MTVNIYDYINKDQYIKICKNLKANETRMIYNDDNIDIAIKKLGRRIIIFVNTYGNKKVNEVLNNICSLV